MSRQPACRQGARAGLAEGLGEKAACMQAGWQADARASAATWVRQSTTATPARLAQLASSMLRMKGRLSSTVAAKIARAGQARREAGHGERHRDCAGGEASAAVRAWLACARHAGMQACRCLPVSDEKRLSTRPAGVASKKAMGRVSTAASSCSCTRCRREGKQVGGEKLERERQGVGRQAGPEQGTLRWRGAHNNGQWAARGKHLPGQQPGLPWQTRRHGSV